MSDPFHDYVSRVAGILWSNGVRVDFRLTTGSKITLRVPGAEASLVFHRSDERAHLLKEGDTTTEWWEDQELVEEAVLRFASWGGEEEEEEEEPAPVMHNVAAVAPLDDESSIIAWYRKELGKPGVWTHNPNYKEPK